MTPKNHKVIAEPYTRLLTLVCNVGTESRVFPQLFVDWRATLNLTDEVGQGTKLIKIEAYSLRIGDQLVGKADYPVESIMDKFTIYPRSGDIPRIRVELFDWSPQLGNLDGGSVEKLLHKTDIKSYGDVLSMASLDPVAVGEIAVTVCLYLEPPLPQQ